MKRGPNARGRRTLAAIEEAALAAAEEMPFGQVTVREICTRAGVSERVFFNHFETREDAFLGHARPTVDEEWAHRLLTDTSVPLLVGAARLVAVPLVPPVVRRRRQELTAAHPELLARAHAVLAPLRVRCVDIVATAVGIRHPQAPPTTVEQFSRMVVAAASEILQAPLHPETTALLRSMVDELDGVRRTS
ncbi:TetR/AcrR family transcriptional regulator [Microbacterium sp. RU33B]|uniref:TetR/AcrR family transcriptional regulator n=1 Tax=Microbacterium sp. RU33B TaxID=1907390 RepID=UPI00095D92D9|nr:TetR family transcriptional regulator [Microbacterium sp. RU33B]SIT67546.1 transcriptional regulator, TetR family [Microbacterium sp. RU33B]